MKGKSDTVPSQENRQGIDDRHQKIVSVLAAHKVALWEYDIRTGVCSFAYWALPRQASSFPI